MNCPYSYCMEVLVRFWEELYIMKNKLSIFILIVVSIFAINFLGGGLQKASQES